MATAKLSGRSGIDVEKAKLGGLSGAILLAAGSQAYATMVSVSPPPDVPAGPINDQFGNEVIWDIDGTGPIIDFTFQHRRLPGIFLDYQANVFPNIYFSNAVVGYTGSSNDYADMLSAGTVIGPASPWVDGFATTSHVVLASQYFFNNYGGFSNGQVGYLGFRFDSPTGTHYGWLEMSVTKNGGIDFISAAYSDTDLPVYAGGGEVPEPGTLAALAFGAAVLLHRPRKS